VLGAEEAAGGERLQLLRLADTFEALADVDKGRDGGVVGAADPSDPGAEVRTGHGLAAGRSRVPVYWCRECRMWPRSGDDVRADQRRPVHDLGDVAPAPARS